MNTWKTNRQKEKKAEILYNIKVAIWLAIALASILYFANIDYLSGII